MTPTTISDEVLTLLEKDARENVTLRVGGSLLLTLLTQCRLARRMEAALRAEEAVAQANENTMSIPDYTRAVFEAIELRRAIIAELDQGKEPK